MKLWRIILTPLDLFVRAVGQLGIWAFELVWWALPLVFKIAWTCVVSFVEFWLVLIVLVCYIRPYKR